MVEVVVDVFDRDWWTAYRDRLGMRFGQEEVHARALAMETDLMTDPKARHRRRFDRVHFPVTGIGNAWSREYFHGPFYVFRATA